MSKSIRIQALSAVLAGVASLGAQAALVPQTVSTFKLHATGTAGVVADQGNTTYTLNNNVAALDELGNHIGVSGAQIGYVNDSLIGLMFKSGSTSFTLDFSKSGLKINALTIDVLHAGDLSTNVGAALAGTSSTPETWRLQGDCAGATPCGSPYLLTQTDGDFLQSITFTRGSTSAAYLITGLSFIDYSAPTSNNVPEPAGFGLAALALLAAGAASRRRAG